jgi:hypothetical protein
MAATTTEHSGPAAAFRDVLSAALELGVSKVSRQTDKLTHKLDDIADHALDGTPSAGGATGQAVVAGVAAELQGKNPVWAAIKAAWSGGSAKAKAAVVAAVVALVLLLVLSPVLLLVFLLSLLIVLVVVKVRSRG